MTRGYGMYKCKIHVIILCLALLTGCGDGLLQKPVDEEMPNLVTERTEQPPGDSSPGPDSPPEEGSPMPSGIPEESTAPSLEQGPPAPDQITELTPTPVDPPLYTQPPFITVKELDTTGLSDTKYGWYFMKNDENLPTRGAAEMDIAAYNGYYLGDTSQRYIWLTFSNGFENGYTSPILDTLREKNVPAAFFVLGTYIRDNPELILRMVEEGHLVVNHSDTHPSMPDISDQQILDEIYGPVRRFKELTGLDMPPFFRPPSGEYSERVMHIAKEAGYITIFWSFAYRDWIVDDQPGKDYAFNLIMDNLHNGEILQLHSVSSSNAEALPDIIDAVRAKGYEFKTLYDLELPG